MLEHPTNNRKFHQKFLRLNLYSVENIGGVNPNPSSVWSRDLLGFVGVAIREKTINSFASDSAHLLWCSQMESNSTLLNKSPLLVKTIHLPKWTLDTATAVIADRAARGRRLTKTGYKGHFDLLAFFTHLVVLLRRASWFCNCKHGWKCPNISLKTLSGFMLTTWTW